MSFRASHTYGVLFSLIVALPGCSTTEDDGSRDAMPDSAQSPDSGVPGDDASGDTSAPPADAADDAAPDPDSGGACACGSDGCVEVFGYPIVSDADGECWDFRGERNLMGCVSAEGAWPEATQCLQSADTAERYVTLNIYAPLLDQGWGECPNSPPPCP